MITNKPDNVWIETKTAEGKSYYYHPRTRETSWTKPESVVILTQEQFNASLQQQQQQQQQLTPRPTLPSLGESMTS